MSSIIVLPRSFSTTLTQVSRVLSIQNISPSQFQTISMDTIGSDSGGNWDAGQSHYVVPSTGLYQITGTIRANDSQQGGIPFGIGVHTSNIDGTWFLWHAIQSTVGSPQYNRTTYPYIRTDIFAAGQRLRMFTYADTGGAFSIRDTVLNIFRVA